jgi:hypothetical protein
MSDWHARRGEAAQRHATTIQVLFRLVLAL